MGAEDERLKLEHRRDVLLARRLFVERWAELCDIVATSERRPDAVAALCAVWGLTPDAAETVLLMQVGDMTLESSATIVSELAAVDARLAELAEGGSRRAT